MHSSMLAPSPAPFPLSGLNWEPLKSSMVGFGLFTEKTNKQTKIGDIIKSIWVRETVWHTSNKSHSQWI